jgi:hypothetical protein
LFLPDTGGNSKASCSMLFRTFIRGIRWLHYGLNVREIAAQEGEAYYFAGLLKDEINAIL